MARGDAAKIKAVLIPDWADRSEHVKVVEMEKLDGSGMMRVAIFEAPLPARLRRKEVLRVVAPRRLRRRLRYVKRGITIEITGGTHPDGSRQTTFHLVVRSGSVIVRERRSRKRRKRRIVTIGGSAVLRSDMELTKAFDVRYWRTG